MKIPPPFFFIILFCCEEYCSVSVISLFLSSFFSQWGTVDKEIEVIAELLGIQRALSKTPTV